MSEEKPIVATISVIGPDIVTDGVVVYRETLGGNKRDVVEPSKKGSHVLQLRPGERYVIEVPG